jgi:predicted regulator of Ras-like GTPase activity (Roadblock/LC7/MglB family)
MLRDRLNEIAERLGTFDALAIVGPDGIAVEVVRADEAVDVDMLCAELVSLVRAMEENHRELPLGNLRGLDITAERCRVTIHSLAGGFWLLLVMPAEEPAGRARFELRRSPLLLADELI